MSTFCLSGDIKQKIKHWEAKFPEGKQQSAVLMALRIVQDTYGFLKPEHLEAVAEYLAMPRMRVNEVATFYNMYRLAPAGKYVLKVCTSISCHLCQAEDIMQHLQQRLSIEVGGTTEDGLFTLEEAECLAACVDAPVMIVNDLDYYKSLNAVKVDAILDDYRRKHRESGL